MKHYTEILPTVRKEVLKLAVEQPGTAFGLSFFVHRVARTLQWHETMFVGRITSRAPKALRGHVQACLAKLAKEGLVYSRVRPELAVPRYEHGETDKRFRLRISSADATKQLLKSNRKR